MKPACTALATITSFLLLGGASQAQWVNYPTPAIPRLPDGSPNLSAPAPRTVDGKPDLSGIWAVECGIYGDALKPWTVVATLNLLPDTELFEAFCDGHDKTMEHRRITPPAPEPPSVDVSGVK